MNIFPLTEVIIEVKKAFFFKLEIKLKKLCWYKRRTRQAIYLLCILKNPYCG